MMHKMIMLVQHRKIDIAAILAIVVIIIMLHMTVLTRPYRDTVQGDIFTIAYCPLLRYDSPLNKCLHITLGNWKG